MSGETESYKDFDGISEIDWDELEKILKDRWVDDEEVNEVMADLKNRKSKWHKPSLKPLDEHKIKDLILDFDVTTSGAVVCSDEYMDWVRRLSRHIAFKFGTPNTEELVEALEELVSRATYSEEKMSCFVKARKALSNYKAETGGE